MHPSRFASTILPALSSEAGEKENPIALSGRAVHPPLPADIRDGIARHGIPNSHLLAIAPTGTISLLGGNVSSGVEPVFSADYQRSVLNADGEPEHFHLTDFAVRLRYVLQRFDFQPDAFMHELVDAIIGDNYPVPDRMLVHAEHVVHEYLMLMTSHRC